MVDTRYLDDDITPMFLGEREKVHAQQKSGIDVFREEMRLEEEAAIDAARPEATAGRIAGGAWQELKHTPVNFAASARSYLEEELARTTDPVSRKNFEELIGYAKDVEESEMFKMDPEYEGPSSGFLEDVARGITGSAPDIALTVISPPIGMAAMFAHIQGASYSEMQTRIKEKFPEMTEREVNKRALSASSVSAAVQTPLELIGNLIKIKSVLGKSGFAKRLGGLAESAFGEGITEYVQQFPEEFAMIWAMNPDLTRKEFFAHLKEQQAAIRKRAGYAAAVGAAAGVGTTSIGQAGVAAIQYISPKQKEINAERDKIIQKKFVEDEIITEKDIAPRSAEREAEEEAAALAQYEEEFGEGETVDKMLKEKLTKEGKDLGKEESEDEARRLKERATDISKLEGQDEIMEEVFGGSVEEVEQKEQQRVNEQLITDKVKEIEAQKTTEQGMAEDYIVSTISNEQLQETHKTLLDERMATIKEEGTGPDVIDKASSVEEHAQVVKQYQEEVASDKEFQGTTTSEENQINSLADDLNVNREDFYETMTRELEDRQPGDPVNRNKIEAWIRIHTDSFLNVQNKQREYLEQRGFLPETESEAEWSTELQQAKMKFVMALEKHNRLTAQLKEAGTTAGESLKAMDDPSKTYTLREANAQMRKDYLDSEAYRLYNRVGIDRVAKEIETLKTVDQLNSYNKKIRRIGISDMLLEVWISALLSNPTTHTVNFTTNTLVDIFAIPERYMGSISSIIRRKFFPGEASDFADTKDPNQMSIEEGEAMSLAYGLMGGLVDALQVISVGVGEYTTPLGLPDIKKIATKIRNESQVRIDYLTVKIKELDDVRADQVKAFRKAREANVKKVRKLATNEINVLKEVRKGQELVIDLELKANLKSISGSNLSTEEKVSKTKEVNRIAKDKKSFVMKDSNERQKKVREQRKLYTDKAWATTDEQIRSVMDEIKKLEVEKLELEKTEGLRGSDNTKLERMRPKTISAKGLRDVKGGIKEYFGSDPVPASYYNLSENPATWIERGFNYLGFVIRAPSSALLVSDKIFKNAVGYRMHLRALAYRKAMHEGMVGKEQSKRIVEIMEDPETHAPEVLEEAHNQAAYQVFVNKLGSFGNQFEKAIGASKIAKVVIPFLRTPVNILKYGFERTPLMLAEKNFWADVKAGGARADMAIGKIAAGSVLATIFAGFALSGMITGSGPPDPDLRNLKRNQGWQPYSFKFKNTYYSFSRTEPFGMLLGSLADGVDLMGEANPGDAKRIAMTLTYSFANNITSKTWCRGVSEFVGVMSNENRYSATYVHKLISSFVPFSSGLNQLKKTGIPGYVEADKVLRDIRIKDRENTFMMEQYYKTLDTIKSRLPGWSMDLQPRLNLWGEEIVLGGGLGPELISPIYTNETKYSPVDEEMYRLGIESDHHFQMPEATVKIQNVSVELTDNEYHHFLKAMNARGVLDKGLTLKESIGKEVELFGKYGYPDEVRFNIISAMLENARAIAKEDLYESFVDVEHYVNTKQKERIAKIDSAGE